MSGASISSFSRRSDERRTKRVFEASLRERCLMHVGEAGTTTSATVWVSAIFGFVVSALVGIAGIVFDA